MRKQMDVKGILQGARALGKRAWARVRLILRELANATTDVLVPVASVLCAMAEALGLPTRVSVALKRAEGWLYGACATAQLLDDYAQMLERAAHGEEVEAI